MDTILTQFGFGQPTQIELLEELSGIVASPAGKLKLHHQAWYPGDTIISGIGQGDMLTTPLQLANGIATFANRGQRVQPTLLIAQQTSQRKLFQPIKPLIPLTISSAAWREVIQAMQAVITEGTGISHYGRNFSYTVAGKTGTAQVFSLKQNQRYHKDMLPEKLRDNSLFIAFAPVDHPQIAVAVVAEHTDIAGNIARQMIDYQLSHSNQQTQPKS